MDKNDNLLVSAVIVEVSAVMVEVDAVTVVVTTEFVRLYLALKSFYDILVEAVIVAVLAVSVEVAAVYMMVPVVVTTVVGIIEVEVFVVLNVLVVICRNDEQNEVATLAALRIETTAATGAQVPVKTGEAQTVGRAANTRKERILESLGKSSY